MSLEDTDADNNSKSSWIEVKCSYARVTFACQMRKEEVRHQEKEATTMLRLGQDIQVDCDRPTDRPEAVKRLLNTSRDYTT